MDEVGGAVPVGRAVFADLVSAAGELLARALVTDPRALEDGELGPALAGLNDLVRDAERLAVRVIASVDRRRIADSYRVGRPGGYRSSRGSCLVEWTRTHAPDMPTSQRLGLVRLAQASSDAECAEDAASRGEASLGLEQTVALAAVPTLAAFDEGVVRTFRADRLVSSLAEVAPFLSAAHGEDSVEVAHRHQRTLIPLLADGSDREVRLGLARFVGGVEPAADAAARARAQLEARSLAERLGPCGTTDFTLRADPVNAAILRAVVNDLSRPAPDDEGADPRTPGQRRFDGLMAVVARGMGAPETRDATPAVTLVVTLESTALAQIGFGKPRPTESENQAEHSDPAEPRGIQRSSELQPVAVGVDGYGHPVPLGQLRRLACHADVIPAVLGGPSVPLDLGRTSRLASPAQRRALQLRDEQCTWPGCTVPAPWCHAHHLTPWSRGGMTDLGQLALLCPRHHTQVHEHDSVGSLVDGRMRWTSGPPLRGLTAVRKVDQPEPHVATSGTPTEAAAS